MGPRGERAESSFTTLVSCDASDFIITSSSLPGSARARSSGSGTGSSAARCIRRALSTIRSWLAPAAIGCAALLVAAPAEADPAERTWSARGELRVGVGDVAVTAAGAAGAIVGSALEPPVGRWSGGILVDEDVRDALRLDARGSRATARVASDVGVSLVVAWPFVADAVVTAWLYRGRPDVALALGVVGAEAVAVALALQRTTTVLVGRERPLGRLCGVVSPLRASDCERDDRYRSFFSGHAALSFTGAGLVCVGHLGLGLLGGAGDVATCVTAYAFAAMTSLSRVMSDMHYASDVAFGALVGSAAGLVLPLAHLRTAPTRITGAALDLRLAPVGQGIGVSATF